MGRRFLPVFLAVLFGCIGSVMGLAPGVGQATNVLRVAAVVNDEPITVLDIIERAALVIATSNLPATPQTRKQVTAQVATALIDERLQLQEAKRRNIEISRTQIQQAIAQIETTNKIPPGSLATKLEGRGIPLRVMEAQVEAGLAWRNVIQQIMARSNKISDTDIDAELARQETNQGKPEYHLSEIQLDITDRRQEKQILQQTRQVFANLKAGAPFAALARQFSQSPTSRFGGDLGWVLAEELDPAVLTVVQDMKPGQISLPFRTLTGFQIIQLQGKRHSGEADPAKTKVRLRQMFKALPKKADQALKKKLFHYMRAVAAHLKRCEDFDKVAPKVKPNAPIDMDWIELAKLRQPMRQVVSALELNQISPPIPIGNGLALLMLCERQVPKADPPSRKEVEKTLFRRRYDRIARRTMRDLRQAAFIDRRM